METKNSCGPALQELAAAVWPSLVERCKDYIAAPKANGYQSLHVTFRLDQSTPASSMSEDEAAVQSSTHASGGSNSGSSDSSSSSSSSAWGEMGPPVSHLELQIRTQRMNALAEQGEAAHTAYKGGLDSRQVGL